MTQLLALGMLGLSGFAIYSRSQRMMNNSLNTSSIVGPQPVAPAQELSSRAYIMMILAKDSSTIALGGELLSALQLMNWVNNPPSPAGDYQNKAVNFANTNIQPILFIDLFALNGLGMMQLCNNVRVNINDSPMVFDLLRRTVINPIIESDLTKVKFDLENP